MSLQLKPQNKSMNLGENKLLVGEIGFYNKQLEDQIKSLNNIHKNSVFCSTVTENILLKQNLVY